MNLGCVVCQCPATPELSTTDGTMENDMKMLLPQMCACCRKVCAVGSIVLKVTQIDLIAFRGF